MRSTDESINMIKTVKRHNQLFKNLVGFPDLEEHW